MLAYRAWYIDATHGEVPPIAILTDPRLHAREQSRQLRRAQVGLFDTPAPVVRGVSASAA